MKITSNAKEVFDGISARLTEALKPENLTRVVAAGIVSTVHNRIHIEGKAADGSAIGSYSSNYLVLREKKYGRLEGNKVVLSLTRQMENDFAAVVGEGSHWGLGFKNVINFDKARYNEEHFDKKIYAFTDSEQAKVTDIATEYIQNIITGAPSA